MEGISMNQHLRDEMEKLAEEYAGGICIVGSLPNQSDKYFGFKAGFAAAYELMQERKLETQCWICPKCCDDHAIGAECSAKSGPFSPHKDDNSFIAQEFRKLQEREKKLVEALKWYSNHDPEETSEYYRSGLWKYARKTLREIGEE